MKLKNKKIKFLSAFVSTSAIVTLAGVGATSCAKTYKAHEEIKNQNATEQTNGLYSTVTFSPEGGVLHGDSSVKVRKGKPFGSIKAPTVTWEDESNPQRFTGWYDNDGNKMEPGTIINDDQLDLKAGWESAQATILTYTSTDGNVSFVGPTTTEIVEGQTFADVSRPTPIHAYGYAFKCWSYKDTPIEDESAITYDDFEPGEENDLTPVFCDPKAYSVEISGDDYSTEDVMAINYKSTFTATVIGQKEVSQVVTWSSSDPDTLSIDEETGEATALQATGEDGVTVTATSTIDGVEVTGEKVVQIVSPEDKYPDEIYAVQNGVENQWWVADQSTICSDDPETKIVLTEATNDSPETLSIDRDTFNYEVHIGANIEQIGDYFLEGCSALNSNILFIDGCKLKSIGDSFLGDCTSFENTNVDLPDGLLSIGSDFMYNCSLYGEGSETTFTLDSSLVYVGESFMVNCNALKGVVVECNPNVIHNETSIDTLTVSSLESYGGIRVEGTYKDQFQSKFPAFDDAEAGLYRRYNN